MRGQMGKLINFMHGRLKPESDAEALHIAAFEGDLEKIRYLVTEQKLDPDLKLGTIMGASVSQSPIFLAINEGNPEAARLLAELGANVDVLDDTEMTPLMVAASCRDTGQVELLLSLGADPGYYRKSDFRCALGCSMPYKLIGTRSKKSEGTGRTHGVNID